MKHNNQIDLQTKNVDSKGRIVLGKQFANRTAIVQYMDDGDIVIRLARIIPESEAWLYENEQALNLLRQGLKEAQELDFSSNPPELERSFSFAAQIPEEE
ncbi:MAG: hypothetical protein WCO81_10455 [Cyanobacteriota bacterium ELA615]|jgi:hypothetical protein